uniref:membrane protein YczE n=1 Tax=Phenylobacterium sp. TaxID=1871053 RepID=UPI0037CA0769
QGVSGQVGLTIGMVVNLTGLVVLLLWIPLRQRPGIGTVANVVMIGTAMDLTLGVLPPVEGLAFQVAALIASIVVNGFAGALYIGAGLGPGPRDGLMTGLARRTGWSLRLVRTGIELTVLALGWALGGTVGVGTLLYAFGIGPIVQFFLPMVSIPETKSNTQETMPLKT